MEFSSIIEKKKNGLELTNEEILFWINEYSKNNIPDYQVSALLMAIRLQGMTKRETLDLTEAMMNSGKVFDLSTIHGITVDKHSTGGVGDKVSLILCPMLAACGLYVAKMSGRGLGFTGGTLDKLESIPGVKVEIESEQFYDIVNRNRLAIIGQSEDLVPADKKLYALRDVTATIDSVPLIASSIMSKKLASGCKCILLDVKYGSGAFMQTREDAEQLAKLMIEIGTYFGANVRAEITSMEQPLGHAIGNSLEIVEAIEVLKGKGPEDVLNLCLSSGSSLLMMAGLYETREESINALKATITDGSALASFIAMVKAQGGDTSYINQPSKFPTAMYKLEVKAMSGGYVSKINASDLGLISAKLGAGRAEKDDLIDPAAGIIVKKKIGDRVKKNDVLMVMYTERPNMDDLVLSALNDFYFSTKPVVVPVLVDEVIRLDKETGQFVIDKEF